MLVIQLPHGLVDDGARGRGIAEMRVERGQVPHQRRQQTLAVVQGGVEREARVQRTQVGRRAEVPQHEHVIAGVVVDELRAVRRQRVDPTHERKVARLEPRPLYGCCNVWIALHPRPRLFDDEAFAKTRVRSVEGDARDEVHVAARQRLDGGDGFRFVEETLGAQHVLLLEVGGEVDWVGVEEEMAWEERLVALAEGGHGAKEGMARGSPAARGLRRGACGAEPAALSLRGGGSARRTSWASRSSRWT